MYFFDNKMKLDLPACFQCLSDKEIEAMFQEKQKPQAVVAGDQGECIAFFLTDKMAENMQLESILDDFCFIIRQRYPANIFQEKGVIRLRFDNLVWMDFRGNSITKTIYYILFLTIINGKLLMGTFQCDWRQMREQKYRILQILEGVARNQQSKVLSRGRCFQENHYDGENLRAGVIEHGKQSTFVFMNNEIIAELDASGILANRYIRGHEAAALEYKGIQYGIHQDEQLSTGWLTGADGAVENACEYDAFGNLLHRHENVPNRLLYGGQQYDPEVRQYYLRARYYNPVVGRFTQEDPYRGDGLNEKPNPPAMLGRIV